MGEGKVALAVFGEIFQGCAIEHHKPGPAAPNWVASGRLELGGEFLEAARNRRRSLSRQGLRWEHAPPALNPCQ